MSLFRRVRFSKPAATTSKLEIQELAKQGAKLLLQCQVANLVEKYAVPHSMIMSFDQTPWKFAPVSSTTLEIRGNLHVAIEYISKQNFN